jgi:hypothetical protein
VSAAARRALGLALGVGLTVSMAATSAEATEFSVGYSGLQSSGDLIHGASLGARWPRGGGSLAFLAELSAQSGTASGESVRDIGLFGGAALAPWSSHRLSPFLSVKAGALGERRQVEVFGVAISPTGVCDGGCSYHLGPAVEAGGGLDLRLGGRWALRLGEAAYRVQHIEGMTDHDVRFGAGIVRR